MRRYENLQVQLRYMGADKEDDEWVDIDSGRLRPPVEGLVGNDYCQVGQTLKVLFDEANWFTPHSKSSLRPTRSFDAAVGAPSACPPPLEIEGSARGRRGAHDPRGAHRYTGSVTKYDRARLSFHVKFEDGEDQWIRLPDEGARIFTPVADLRDALSRVKKAPPCRAPPCRAPPSTALQL